MPKVQLLGQPWQTYTLFYRMTSFLFRGGEPREVPVAIAMELQKKSRKGKPLFLVEDMPVVVEQVKNSEFHFEQNPQMSRQTRFEAWPLEPR